MSSLKGNGIGGKAAGRTSLFQRIYYWIFPEIKLHHELTYADTMKFLKDDLTRSIKFNETVCLIGIGSIILWFILMIGYAIMYDFYVFLNKDFYPGAISGFMIAAFTQMEVDRKKRELCSLIAKSFDAKEGEMPEGDQKKDQKGSPKVLIIEKEKIKEAAWEEYKNRFQ